MYRGRGISYTGYIDDFFGRRKSLYNWEGSGFSEEERKRLIAFARLKELDDEKSNYALDKKTPDQQTVIYSDKVRKEVKELKVTPADQPFMRGVIAGLIDRTLDKP